VTSASNALIALAVFSVVMILFLVFFGEPPGGTAVALFVLYQLHYLVIVVGISLAASVLFLRYRDLNQVWEVVLQAGFFVAPIIYPLALIPEKAHASLYLWPPTPIIQFSRSVLIEGVIPTDKAHFMLTACSLAILAVGVVFHRNLAPRAAEYL
jgi:lipopolysaccharide transport system permease protein